MADTKVVITAETGQAESALSSLTRSVDGISKGFLSFTGIAGALSVGAFASFVKKSIDAADELAVLSEKTGTTVESLAGLKYAAEQNDTSLKSVAEAAKKFSTVLAEKPELLRQYGIDATDTTGAMLQLSDIFQSMPDGVEKSALAVKLLGKSGEEMIPLLNQGSDALAGFIEEGQKIYPITTQSAAAARQFNDDMAKMQAQVSGLGMALGADLVPAFTWVIDSGIKPFIGGIKMMAVDIAHFVARTAEGIDRLTSPSTWGKEGTEAYRARLKELARIAEEEKIGIAASMEGIGATTPTVSAPKAAGSGRSLLGALGGNNDDEKAAREQARIDAEIERQQAKYDKLHEMAVLYSASDEERVQWKLGFDLSRMEQEKQQAIEHKAWNEDLEASYQQARIDREAMAAEEIRKINEKAAADKEKQDLARMRSDMSIANFSKLLRRGEYTDAMTMAERLTAGLATKNRAAFEVNRAASLAKATVQGYQMIQAAAADGASWGGYAGGIAEGALAAAYVAANLDAINSAQFGGGSSIPSGGGSVPSQATSPGIPVAEQGPASQQQPLQVNIYNTGTFVDAQAFVDQTVIPQIKDAVQNRDVMLIDPRSRQAQALGS